MYYAAGVLDTGASWVLGFSMGPGTALGVVFDKSLGAHCKHRSAPGSESHGKCIRSPCRKVSVRPRRAVAGEGQAAGEYRHRGLPAFVPLAIAGAGTPRGGWRLGPPSAPGLPGCASGARGRPVAWGLG